MTKLTVDRATIEQALDALLHRTGGSDQQQRIDAAITGLRAALAKKQANCSWQDGVLEGQLRERERWLAQEQAKPVCKCDLRTRLVGDGCEVCNPELAAEFAQTEPVAVVRSVVGQGDEGVRIKWLGGFPQIGDRLYTTPPQRPPLTDEEIAEIYLEWDAAPGRSMAGFARAIEKKVRGEE